MSTEIIIPKGLCLPMLIGLNDKRQITKVNNVKCLFIFTPYLIHKYLLLQRETR